MHIKQNPQYQVLSYSAKSALFEIICKRPSKLVGSLTDDVIFESSIAVAEAVWVNFPLKKSVN